MSDWCLSHPWMTFIVVLVLADGFARTIVALAHKNKPRSIVVLGDSFNSDSPRRRAEAAKKAAGN